MKTSARDYSIEKDGFDLEAVVHPSDVPVYYSRVLAAFAAMWTCVTWIRPDALVFPVPRQRGFVLETGAANWTLEGFPDRSIWKKSHCAVFRERT